MVIISDIGWRQLNPALWRCRRRDRGLLRLFWAWLRLGKPICWIVPGVALLVLFAWLLTRVDSAAAGRTYAAYGGVYIIGSLAWLWLVEDLRPDRWDLLGGADCLVGAAIILSGQR